jgi:hypothetical protein
MSILIRTGKIRMWGYRCGFGAGEAGPPVHAVRHHAMSMAYHYVLLTVPPVRVAVPLHMTYAESEEATFVISTGKKRSPPEVPCGVV